jgi:hypothetical protein
MIQSRKKRFNDQIKKNIIEIYSEVWVGTAMMVTTVKYLGELVFCNIIFESNHLIY